MNNKAYQGIEQAWRACLKVRALCPSANDNLIGCTGYPSPGFYVQRGIKFFVKPEKPFTPDDLAELRDMTAFVNRSFIIVMVAILEAHGVVPYRTDPDQSREGGKHTYLVKKLRNKFAHGEIDYNPGDEEHVEIRELMEELLPNAKDLIKEHHNFPAAINSVLEPLKDGVLLYVASA